jgi:hypothetical protein
MTTAQPHDGEPEVDWTWTAEDSSWIPPEIDTTRPSPARMYDYALGGKDNFAADRAAVEAVGQVVPEFRAVGLANRGFLVRAVDTIARQGVDQFIDLGTGIPTSPNVHEVARQVHPQARVVYVDNDPIVMAYNRALRVDRHEVIALDCDLRRPATVMDHPAVRQHLNFDKPIGLLFVAVLHFVGRELAIEVVKQFTRALPPGSFLAISAACSDGVKGEVIDRLEEVYAGASSQLVLRSKSQIEQLFDGIELVEPGLVDVTQWRSDGQLLPLRVLSGVGRVVS